MGSATSIAPTAKQQAGAWNASFEEWQPGAGHTILRAYSDAVNRRLLGRWLPASTGRILKTDLFDEAVGTGLVGFLLERAAHVSGIDVAPSVVAAAREAHPQLDAVPADVRALPFPDGAFDVVVSTSTLDHFDSEAEIEQALQELSRVLRPGGSLIVSLDNASNPLVALRNALPHRLLRRAGLVPYPTGRTCGLNELCRLVERAGLEVEDTDAIMHVPRLVVRAAGPSVAGNPARMDGLVSRLVEVEPPLQIPLRTVTGQFVAVRATRPAERGARRRESPEPAPRSHGRLAGGPRALAMRILGRSVYRRLEWLEVPLRPPFPEVEPLVPLDTGFLGAADVEELVALRPKLDHAAVRTRFARGDRCFGARHDGQLVANVWVATGTAPIDYLGLAVTLGRGVAYRYDLWVDPRARGLRVAPAIGSRLSRLLANEGITCAATAVLHENRAAMSNAHRIGYRPAGVVGWVGVGPVRRAFRRVPRRA